MTKVIENYLVFFRHFDSPFTVEIVNARAKLYGMLISGRLLGNFCGQRLPLLMADEVTFSALSEEDKKKLADNSKIVSEFKQKKLEKEAQKNWDLFYKRNATNFFKDRHWTTAEFEELLSLCEKSDTYNEVSAGF